MVEFFSAEMLFRVCRYRSCPNTENKKIYLFTDEPINVDISGGPVELGSFVTCVMGY